MKKQAFNPYLPSWEYIPDGEPYVFNGRVYVYGSHDFYNGYAVSYTHLRKIYKNSRQRKKDYETCNSKSKSCKCDSRG